MIHAETCGYPKLPQSIMDGIVDDDRYTYDLHAMIPYHSMDEAERKEIWDDGLHLTPKGYERMGELIGERLAELIKETE